MARAGVTIWLEFAVSQAAAEPYELMARCHHHNERRTREGWRRGQPHSGQEMSQLATSQQKIQKNIFKEIL